MFKTYKSVEDIPPIPDNPNALKRYEITRPSTMSTSRLEVRRDGHIFLWADAEKNWLKSATMKLHKTSVRGPMVAGAKFAALSSKIEIVLGDPDQAGGQTYTELRSDSMFKSTKTFTAADGRKLVWKTTHDKALGASRLSGDNYKLVDSADESKILMTFIHSQSWGWSKTVGVVDFLDEVSEELELQAIMCVLAIFYRIAERRATSITSQSPVTANAANVAI